MSYEVVQPIDTDDGAERNAEAPSPIVEIQKIPGLPKGFFNAAACKLNDDPSSPTLLLGRYIDSNAEPNDSIVDVSSLDVATLINNTAVSFKEVWRPEEGRAGDLLEDPRFIELPDGRIFTGFTRLAQHEGKYLWFPAVSISSPEALFRGEFPQTHIITGLGSGDQTTPIGEGRNRFHVLEGKNTMPLKSNLAMFRHEADSHRFIVFSAQENGEAQALQYLEIPKAEIPFWGWTRMGLTMPPLWRSEREALLFIHGYNVTEEKYKYHVGTSRLIVDKSGRYRIDNVSQEPLLAPESFKDMFPGEQVERHPEIREALYLCGGIPIYDAYGNLKFIDLYPSIGDTYTVKATVSVPEITASWARREAYGQAQPTAA